MRGKMLMFLAMLCLFLLAFGTGYLKQQTRILEQEVEQLRSELRTQELQLKINQHQLEVSRHLLDEIARLRQESGELQQRMHQWLDSWEVDVWEATAYAPLDPKAQEGMCYEGNPHVTASGAQVIPYTTAAAGSNMEFGKRVYVVGDGPRVVQDRGAMIGERNIDLAMLTKAEALLWGNKTVKVVYQK